MALPLIVSAIMLRLVPRRTNGSFLSMPPEMHEPQASVLNTIEVQHPLNEIFRMWSERGGKRGVWKGGGDCEKCA